MTDWKFHSEDNDNCRVYYLRGRRWHCWQDEGKWGWSFYVCTQDGEPSHEVASDGTFERTPGKTRVGCDLNALIDAGALRTSGIPIS